MRLLALDTQHAELTGVFTLYNSDKTDSYMFETAEELRQFTIAYYYSPIAAVFAYRCSHD